MEADQGLPSPWGGGGGCAVARKGLPARKSLPVRLRGRDREGLFWTSVLI